MVLWNKLRILGGKDEAKTCLDIVSFVWCLLGNRNFSRADRKNLLLCDFGDFGLGAFSSYLGFVIKTMRLGEEIR